MGAYAHVTAAAQMLAKRFHNGIAGLATVMGKNPTTLANKLNPNYDSNQLTLEEAAEITDRTQDPAIADALAALCNRTTVALPSGDISMKDLAREFCRLTAECGHVGHKIDEAEHPDSEWGEQISPGERKQIAIELRHLLSATVGMLRRVEG
ncbi:phage regulatory CII family protein [Laribacter hongkongensis]|uniref:phage regulatory CII family protein n=1 Tax=Laribacter hongkongensis TaxID=168471 RepID=UPI000403FA9A|nr:phage regulatory CII family protein [Laribacter hongkongensis]